MSASVRSALRPVALVVARTWLRVRRPGTVPGDVLLRMLRFGWGNPKWAASLAYLRATAQRACVTSGTVVEAGSGLTTVMLSYVVPLERQLVALEHIGDWADRVNRRCRPGRSPAAVVSLGDCGDHDWYQPPEGLVRAPVGLFICDGPPESTRGGRYGGLPALRPLMDDDAVILVDDVERPGEQEVLARWQREFGTTVALHRGAERGYAVVSLPSADA